MKKIIVLSLVSLFALPLVASAQTNSDKKNSEEKKVEKRKKPLYKPSLNTEYRNKFKYPITLGLVFNGNFPVPNGDTVGFGGGFGVRTKISFLKWMGLSVDLSYNTFAKDTLGKEYGKDNNGKPVYGARFDLIEFKPMIVFQNETRRGYTGFVPWGGIGMTLGESVIRPNKFLIEDTKKDNYFGFAIAGGFRYNFPQDWYVGADLSWQTANGFQLDLSGFRLNIEAGYRF